MFNSVFCLHLSTGEYQNEYPQNRPQRGPNQALTAATPEEDILTRAGGGFEMSYVTGEYVKRTMLNVFGGAVRYQVLNHVVDKGSLILHVSVEYPLYENHKNGSVISDTWGRVEEFGTSTIRTDFGQAWKTAFTDALKRAATHLGIGLDLYHKTQEAKGRSRRWKQASVG